MLDKYKKQNKGFNQIQSEPNAINCTNREINLNKKSAIGETDQFMNMFWLQPLIYRLEVSKSVMSNILLRKEAIRF